MPWKKIDFNFSDLKRIGTYSGHIPSTPFIEHLLAGIAGRGEFGLDIYGVIKRMPVYPDTVKIRGIPASQAARVLFVIRYFIQLLFLKTGSAIKIARHLSKSKKGFYAILWDACLALPILCNPPDVFHLQWTKTIANMGWLVDLNVCSVIVSLRGSHVNYSPLIEPGLKEVYRSYFPRITAFHAVSQAIVKEGMKYGVTPEKVSLIHSIVPDAVLNRYRAETGLRSGRLKLLSVGRFHWSKGYEFSLQSALALKAMKIDFEYTIVAGGAVPEDIIFQMSDSGLLNNVKIIPGMMHDEVLRCMQQHDLLILPSVAEGIANVVLEAMAVGLPVITTDCGGMAELVTNRINGWIVPRRDPRAIVLAIEDYLNTDEGELRQIRQRAHDFISTHFNEQVQIEKFSQLYRQTLAAKN